MRLKPYCIAVIFAVFAIPFFLSCIYPVFDGDYDFLEEQQSVWQYLNVFSIYQDRLPAECGNLSPDDLFNIIDDMLKGGRYTGYDPTRSGGASAGLLASQANRNQMLAITDSTAYFRISEFFEADLDSFNVWRGALERFPNIVIDLRNNGGGSLYVTDSIVGEFLPRNTGFIKTRYREYDHNGLRGRTVPSPTEWTERRSAKTRPRLLNKNISVIINDRSASASEILASALKERAGANLIALPDTKSYGKGIGQVIIPRTGRDGLMITFMQIRGVSERTGDYHNEGIEPDTIPAALREEASDSCVVQISESQRVVAQTLYCAVKLLEPSASGERIRKAAETIEKSRALGKAQGTGPVGVYVISEPDPLK